MVHSSGVLRRAQCDAQLTACMSVLVNSDETVFCPSCLCMGVHGARQCSRLPCRAHTPSSRAPE